MFQFSENCQHIIDKQEDWLSDSRRYLLGFYEKWVPLHRDLSDDLLSVLMRIIAPNITEETSDPLDNDVDSFMINIMNMEQYSFGERIIRLHLRDYFLHGVQTQRNWLIYGINKFLTAPTEREEVLVEALGFFAQLLNSGSNGDHKNGLFTKFAELRNMRQESVFDIAVKLRSSEALCLILQNVEIATLQLNEDYLGKHLFYPLIKEAHVSTLQWLYRDEIQTNQSYSYIYDTLREIFCSWLNKGDTINRLSSCTMKTDVLRKLSKVVVSQYLIPQSGQHKYDCSRQGILFYDTDFGDCNEEADVLNQTRLEGVVFVDITIRNTDKHVYNMLRHLCGNTPEVVEHHKLIGESDFE